MIRQAYSGIRPRLVSLAALSAAGFLACASPASNNTGGAGGNSATGGNGQGGSSHTGGTNGAGGSNTGSGGSNPGSGGVTNTGGSNPGSGGSHTGGTTGAGGSNTGSGGTTATGAGGTNPGSGGSHTGGTTGSGGAAGSAGGSSGCSNTDMSVINEDSSGYVCNNNWGIKGAWYCYSDGSDSTISCKGSNGKGMGAVPWNTTSNAMCLSGTMGTGSGSYAGIGFKVNSGPPGSTAAAGSWDASKIVGFAITLTSGSSGKGSGGMILNLEYPTTTDLDSQTQDAPGITVPGVPTSGSITYNALFSDSVLANNINNRHNVDPANLTDVKIAFFPDSTSHTYDFCIKSVVPLMSAPNAVVATGAYGPTWTNQTGQAVNGINGYAVQNAPFSQNGLPMTMQVMATATGVGFTYTAKQGASGNSPASFPAVISGWGPGEAGIQLYGPYQANTQISALQTVTSNWSFTTGSSGDAAYDVWFGPNKAPTTAPAVELMIWINNGGKQPIGAGNAAGAAVTGSDGVARTPYVGTNGTNQMVVSYVGTSSSTSVTNFDLLKYFNDAAGKYAGLQKSYYLLGVQTGFEVYSADTWKTTDYNITIK